ncbi:MAG: hypothetical protein KGJ57_18085 [Sphingomonadales bacterium]|nr:hypothetical protein [Sphingomonadales bacterium]MDE2171308.1 hypothetical protein [Sphingomonadales bacterium]
MNYAAAVHAGFATFLLLICLTLPRPGANVLLVPLRADSQPVRAAMSAARDVSLLGPGMLKGSVVVRSGHGLMLGRLLAQGVLPIGVPALLCGQPDAYQGSTGSPE